MKVLEKIDKNIKSTPQSIALEALFSQVQAETKSLSDEFSKTLDKIVGKVKENSSKANVFAEHFDSSFQAKSKDSKKQYSSEKSEIIQNNRNKSETILDNQSDKKADINQSNTKHAESSANETSAESENQKNIAKSEIVNEDKAEIAESIDSKEENLESDSAEVIELSDNSHLDESLKLEVNAASTINPVNSVNQETPKTDSIELIENNGENINLEQTGANEEVIVAENLENQTIIVDETGQKPTSIAIPELIENPESISTKENSLGKNSLEANQVTPQSELDQYLIIETGKKSSSNEQDNLDSILKEQILEKLITSSSSDIKSLNSQIFNQDSQLSRSISSNFAALAESVLLQNSTQSMVLKSSVLAAENSLKSAAQGLQINSGTGVVTGQKSAEIAGFKPESKETMKSLPKPLEARTLERVENALKEVARSKDGKTISVRLDPPELGTVKIDVSQRDNGIHARLVAESPQVNAMLKEKASEVVSMLRKLGLNVDKVSVSVSNQEENLNRNFEKNFDSSVSDRNSNNNKEGSSGNRNSRNDSSRANLSASLVYPKNNSVVMDHWVA
jgi:hypothetical protein